MILERETGREAPHIVHQNNQNLPDGFYVTPSIDPLWGEAKTFKEHSRMVVIGHRGCGMNKQDNPDNRPSILENTIASFNVAASSSVDFVEFDVQVTKDGHPVIFHDDEICAEFEDGIICRRIRELTLNEFLSIGHQKHGSKLEGRKLFRKAMDGTLRKWTASQEGSLCTLEEAFVEVNPSVGFNIEVKFDDKECVPECEIKRTISQILQVVQGFSMDRKICFSSFHPDAVHIIRKEQSIYPVFFLTNGGTKIYEDQRRNSIQEAVQMCITGGLQGIVSAVKAILQDPEAVKLIKEAGLCLLTYGELNNMVEAIHTQEELGVDGVIVDHVLEIVMECRKFKRERVFSSMRGLRSRGNEAWLRVKAGV